MLRVFEAAARHESFRRAAEELHVTPAAVSLRMRELEALLGTRLFERRPRGLRLTAAGRDYRAEVAAAMARIADATARLTAPGRDGPLRVGVGRSFALLWLLPRLAGFRLAHPGIDLRLDADDRLADPGPAGPDLAVRFGPGRYAGLRSELLMADSVVPVCAPALLGGGAPPRRPADLLAFPLLHDDGLHAEETATGWPGWLADAGLGMPGAGIHLPDAALVLQAALLGQGVALVRRSLAEAHLAAGRLVRVLGHEIPTAFAYWIVLPGGGPPDARAAAFRDWIRREAGA